MSRLSVVALPCVLAIASASCRVYESELLELATGGRAVHVNASSQVLDAALDAEAPVIVPACGNGRVEGREHCDIAIAQGEPGACPDACDMRDACLTYELVGKRCGARCSPIEITDSAPGDGCCPTGATPDTDSDCSATCGNGVIEPAETCDPPESCPNQESCHTTKACMTTHLTGAAGTCNARCRELPIEECKSGDECCPDGCTATADRDCKISGESKPMQPTMTMEAGTADPATEPMCAAGRQCSEEQMQSECAMVHSGSPCHSCDCAYCASNVAACAAATKDTGACSRVVECALQNHCQGLACLCGQNLSTCQNRPLGPCLWEIQDLAGSRDYYDILWTASTPGTPLAIAMNLVQCRADHCAQSCGL